MLVCGNAAQRVGIWRDAMRRKNARGGRDQGAFTSRKVARCQSASGITWYKVESRGQRSSSRIAMRWHGRVAMADEARAHCSTWWWWALWLVCFHPGQELGPCRLSGGSLKVRSRGDWTSALADCRTSYVATWGPSVPQKVTAFAGRHLSLRFISGCWCWNLLLPRFPGSVLFSKQPFHHGERLARRGRHDGRGWRLSARAMVLRDARMYALVDDGGAERKCAGAMPHHLAFPALLQCAHCLLQEPGQSIPMLENRCLR